jgi:TonB-linked SusC/RagA family outer membrane protein
MNTKFKVLYMKQLLLIFFIGFFTLTASFAQSKFLIRGRITDANTGEAVIGANIIEYDAQKRIINGSITDVNGYFTINTRSSEALLGFSSIGYEKKEVEVNGRSELNIALKSESTELEEVVITAKSTADPLTGMSERNIVSSRVKVDMSESLSMGVASAGEALQGKISGVDITSVSGNPGSGASIVIRGLGSLGNSQPLIVVDGIKQNVNTGGFEFSSADQEDLGSLVNIAPQDIKSIEVLKDAASTAVWGSEGADGVLLIETYKGSRGKTKFFYNSKFTVSVQPPAIPMLNGDEYIMLQLEEWHNARGVFDLPPEIAYDKDYFDFYNYSANTDWISEITRTGITSDQFFKLEGGGEKTLYYASVSYLNDIGTVDNTDFNRITTRLNLDYNISSKLKFTMLFNYTNSLKGDNYSPSTGNDKKRSNIRAMAYQKSPNMSIWEYDPEGNLTGEYFSPIQTYQGTGTQYYNPVAVADLSVNDIQTNEVSNTFVLNYNLASWIRFRETISLNYNNQSRSYFVPYNAVGAIWIDNNKNEAKQNVKNNQNVMTRSQLFFTPRINSTHVISGTLMWETTQSQAEYSILSNNRGPSVDIKDPSANSQWATLQSGSNENRALGALANINYTLKDRYIFQANVRVDGSSKFGTSQRWGLFPSISAGWRFSSESIFENQQFLSDGKLRVSWGQAGKQPNNPYDRHAIYNTMTPNQYILNPIIIPVQVQLDNLRWQTVSSWNVGLDLSFLAEKVNMTAEVYNKITDNLLWEGGDKYQIPTTSGYTELKAYNAGSVQNQGWEVFVNGLVMKRNKQSLSLNFNISRNYNTFLKFPENFENEKDISIGNGEYPRRADEGVPVGSFYGFIYEGVWARDEDVVALNANGEQLMDVYGDPIPLTYNEEYEFKGGDAIYKDVNNDGKIDLLDVVYLGDSNPDFIGSFGFNYEWSRLSFNAMFFYRYGYQIVNEVAINTEGMLGRDNQSKAVLRRWRTPPAPGEELPDNILPRAYLLHPANNLGSDRYIEDGSFMRLNNLSISYRFPQEMAKKLNLNLFQISLNMRKLLTITNYSGQDPEVSQKGSDPFWIGTDNANTPPPKVFTLSINIGF